FRFANGFYSLASINCLFNPVVAMDRWSLLEDSTRERVMRLTVWLVSFDLAIWIWNLSQLSWVIA
ncbi:MAG: hypothetical protein AAF483_24095, partial [Planctomycetota bacterium]